jgi:hypothetical protein
MAATNFLSSYFKELHPSMDYKTESKHPVDKAWTPLQEGKGYRLHPAVKGTFQFTYICLFTTATITFIEALRTNTAVYRHVMNLETAISLIAGYFYSIFYDRIQQVEQGILTPFSLESLTLLRYSDWCLTTPLMLTVLIVVMAHNMRTPVHFHWWVSVLFLNFVMLGMGYLGESGMWNRIGANLVGFVAFFAMFYILYRLYIQPRFLLSNFILFGLYFVVWSFYGIAYFFDNVYKNTMYNVLDVVSKVFVGLGLWVYFSGIVQKW